jgi:hypothetical protein
MTNLEDRKMTAQVSQDSPSAVIGRPSSVDFFYDE